MEIVDKYTFQLINVYCFTSIYLPKYSIVSPTTKHARGERDKIERKQGVADRTWDDNLKSIVKQDFNSNITCKRNKQISNLKKSMFLNTTM